MNQQEIRQREIERKHYKFNISELLSEKINNDHSNTLLTIEDRMYNNMMQYMQSKYHDSKRDRIDRLINISMGDLIHLVLNIVVLHGRTNKPTPIQTFAGIMGGELNQLSTLDGVKTAAELLAVCQKDNDKIYTFGRDHLNRITITSNVVLDDELKQALVDSMYLPPMLCKPRYIKSNTDNGYMTINRSPVVLGTQNQPYVGNKQLSLDVINTQNQVPLCLDIEILQYEEVSKKPLDTVKKRDSFNLMRDTSTEVYQMMLDEGNHFYVNHKFDKRGRLNAQGYHINYQGNSYKKACISLVNKEVFT